MERASAYLITVLAMSLLLSMLGVTIAPQPPLLADTLVVAETDEPETADPAWATDAASQELIFNVYDTLVCSRRWTTSGFESMLAESWTASPDGMTLTFKMRSGAKFHNGAVLTPEDVEYSFEREMVIDREGGPSWILLEPLLDISSTREYDLTDETQIVELGQRIDAAVESTADSVAFNFVKPNSETLFLQALADPSSSILNKVWSVEHGCWPGEWGDYKHWIAYNDPPVSPLDDPEPVFMGTGAFKFDYWDKTVEMSIVKFDDYWGGWPAPGSRGFVTRVIIKTITEWVTRKLMFLAGDVDIADVPVQCIEQIFYEPGIRGIFSFQEPVFGLFWRDWVCGMGHKPLIAYIDCYHLWKQIVPPCTGYPPEDVDENGIVNIVDLSDWQKSGSWGAYCTPTYVHKRWNCWADINGDHIISYRDLRAIAKKFGTGILPPG